MLLHTSISQPLCIVYWKHHLSVTCIVTHANTAQQTRDTFQHLAYDNNYTGMEDVAVIFGQPQLLVVDLPYGDSEEEFAQQGTYNT